MDRRRFVRLCAGSAAMLAAGLRTVRADDFADLPKVRLTDAQGAPLKAASLSGDEAYVFYFPFRSVPCFLINLGKSAPGQQKMAMGGESYTWPGGVGRERNIVAYVAVCSHQLSYPDKEDTEIRYAAKGGELTATPGMIVCCAHDSVFDPADGARQVHGQATDPLAPVRLEYNPSTDGLFATGLAGMQLVDRFFTVHKRHLIEAYGPGVYREPVMDAAAAVPLSKLTASVDAC